MSGLDHVILTRFNLPSEGNESLVRARDGWLSDRVVLFERYCLPSVRAQSCRNFRWIIYFDPESPDWLKARLEEWRENEFLHPIVWATVSRDEMVSDLVGVVGEPGSALITTNLDNDDGLATDFIERLQAEYCPEAKTALYLTNGLIKRGDRVYLRTDKDNAFCSVREDWSDPVGCWATPHNHLHRIMATRPIGGEPAWLQVVHGANVSNRVRGRLVSPARYRKLFLDMLEDVKEPRKRDFLGEALVHQPRRFLREFARQTVKQLVWRAFGFQALDRMKKMKTAIAGRLSQHRAAL